MIAPLDADLALTNLFHRAAVDPKFDASKTPQMSEKGWAAYLDYLEKLKRPHKPRGSDGKLHLSSMSGYSGYECDLNLFFAATLQPKEPPLPGKEGPLSSLQRCFAVGHAMEAEMYKWIGPALELYYENSDFQILDLRFEVPVYSLPNCQFAEDGDLISGTADMVLDYRKDGVEARGVLDCKSTSSNNAKKRTRAGVVTADPGNERQVLGYIEPLDADWGALIYWTKTWPHDFVQASVRRKPGYYKNVAHRARVIDAHVREGRHPLPSLGSHCAECSYPRACKSLLEVSG